MNNHEQTLAILIKMQSMQKDLTKAENKVAEVIMADPQKVIYSSVADLAAASHVSDPTVIRLCRKLGLEGYQDLKLTLAKEIVNPMQAIDENIVDSDDTATIVGKIFAGTVNTLTLTHDNLSIPDMEKATELLTGAQRIIIIGMGNSHAICLDMQHKLLRLNLNATAYSDPHMATIAISNSRTSDVLFCISQSGSSKEVVDLARQARNVGMQVISLTNIGLSPLSKISTLSLHTTSNETRYRILGRESRIAELTVIDCLYTLLTLRTGHTDFFTVEEALKKHKY